MNVKFMRLEDVEARTGLKQSTLYAMMAAGEFPRPLKLTKRAVAWLEEDVQAWQRRILAAHGRLPEDERAA